MTSGEAFRVIALTGAFSEVLLWLTHLVIFSDSSASGQLINSGNSGSPQMNYLMSWFVQRRPSLSSALSHGTGRQLFLIALRARYRSLALVMSSMSLRFSCRTVIGACHVVGYLSTRGCGEAFADWKGDGFAA